MAKLSAHGIELLRIERERQTPDDPDTIWERITRSYRADGKILQKEDIRFKPDSTDPQGRLYSGSWKLASRVRRDQDIKEAFRATLASITLKPELGWVVVVNNLGL